MTHFRTATSWIREAQSYLSGKERKRTGLRDRLSWPELWWGHQHVFTCLRTYTHLFCQWHLMEWNVAESGYIVSLVISKFNLLDFCRSSSAPKTTRSQLMWRRWMTEPSRRFSSSCFRGGQWRIRRKGSAKGTPEGKWVCVIWMHAKRKINMSRSLWLINFLWPSPFSLFSCCVATAHIVQEKFDATLMHAMPQVAAQERVVDNGTGQVEVSDSRGSFHCKDLLIL